MIEIASSARKLQDLLSTSAADKVQSIDRYESCESVVEERESSVFGNVRRTSNIRAISNKFLEEFVRVKAVHRPTCTAVSSLRIHRTPAVRR